MNRTVVEQLDEPLLNGYSTAGENQQLQFLFAENLNAEKDFSVILGGWLCVGGGTVAWQTERIQSSGERDLDLHSGLSKEE